MGGDCGIYGSAMGNGRPDPRVLNTTLVNGSFTAGQNGAMDQWESVGNVAAAPSAASQAVTLGESTTAQAHLGQAFVLSAQDRFLTFTVSGLDLQSNSIEQNGVFTAAPQDAFEVALQNGNTGANLLAAGTSNLGANHTAMPCSMCSWPVPTQQPLCKSPQSAACTTPTMLTAAAPMCWICLALPPGLR